MKGFMGVDWKTKRKITDSANGFYMKNLHYFKIVKDYKRIDKNAMKNNYTSKN